MHAARVGPSPGSGDARAEIGGRSRRAVHGARWKVARRAARLHVGLRASRGGVSTARRRRSGSASAGGAILERSCPALSPRPSAGFTSFHDARVLHGEFVLHLPWPRARARTGQRTVSPFLHGSRRGAGHLAPRAISRAAALLTGGAAILLQHLLRSGVSPPRSSRTPDHVTPGALLRARRFTRTSVRPRAAVPLASRAASRRRRGTRLPSPSRPHRLPSSVRKFTSVSRPPSSPAALNRPSLPAPAHLRATEPRRRRLIGRRDRRLHALLPRARASPPPSAHDPSPLRPARATAA